MDKMDLNGGLICWMLAKLLKKAIYKKYQCNMDICIDELEVSSEDLVNVKLTVRAKTKKEEFVKIVKNLDI